MAKYYLVLLLRVLYVSTEAENNQMGKPNLKDGVRRSKTGSGDSFEALRLLGDSAEYKSDEIFDLERLGVAMR